MTLAHDSDHIDWVCGAERPNGRSYLFFEEFKLQLTGAQLEQVTAEVTVTLITVK